MKENQFTQKSTISPIKCTKRQKNLFKKLILVD